MKKNNLFAHLALLAVALIYGTNYLVAKHVMNGEYMGPLGFVAVRVIMATIMFWAVSLFTTGERIARSDLPLVLLCGLTGVAINQTMFFSGLELTTPIHASLIMTTNPVLVLIFSHFLLHEKITSRKVLGIVMGCIGAILLITFGKEIGTGENTLMGDIMVFINAMSYGLYLVLVKRLTSRYSPLTVIRYVFTAGLLFVAPVGFGQLRVVEWHTFSPSVWAAVAYVVVFVTFLAYLLNIFALRQVNPSTVSIYIYLQPLFASILSTFFGMENLTPVKLLSGLLIFTGVFLVSDYGSKRRAKAGNP